MKMGAAKVFRTRPFCLPHGLWSWVFGLRTLNFGLWCLVFGLWSLEFEIWNLESGIWSLELTERIEFPLPVFSLNLVQRNAATRKQFFYFRGPLFTVSARH